MAKSMTTIQDRIIEKLYELTEQLADIEHQRWSDWQSYLHSKLTYSEYQKDGKNYACYILDAGDFEHWSRQIDTDYKSLTEKEKNSDREQVDRYMPIIKQFLLTSIKEVEEETRKEITDDLGKLMDIDRARKLGDNLEIYQGKRECPICGANPEKQREMILSITNKDIKK